MRTRLFLIAVVAVAVLGTGCATPYIRAQRAYWGGDPAMAMETLRPVYDRAAQKNTNDLNLYRWDLGVYCLSAADYTCAIEQFTASVQAYAQIDDVKATAGKVLRSAGAVRYVGDPVEISVAYFFLGLAYYLSGDAQNAQVALRRSIEEDLCKDAGCEGNMVATNFILGEVLAKSGRKEDAAVAYRRCLQFNAGFLPACAALNGILRDQGKIGDAELLETKIDSLGGAAYLEAVRTAGGRGAMVLLYADRASRVTQDPVTGMFRVRKDHKPEVKEWALAVSKLGSPLSLSTADDIRAHLHEQGGAKSEARKQLTRYAVSKCMEQIPCVGVFAPSTAADVRYWVTMPGYFVLGYLPLEAGTYDVAITAKDARDRDLPKLAKRWTGIKVGDGARSLLIGSGYVPKPANSTAG